MDGTALHLIDTPALILDRAVLDRNIRQMAAWAADKGIALRPHTKTHKCTEIGRRQMAAGAVGLCCAKLGEAEAMADGGLGPLLLTSPIRGATKLARLTALLDRSPGLMLVVDDLEHADELAATGLRLQVLIDVDVEQHRFGVPSVEAALAVVERIAKAPSLELVGVQGYGGQLQHIEDFEERRRAARIDLQRLADVRDALRAAGHPIRIVTGGGTGTHAVDAELDLFTDLQVGSYVVSDVEYDAVAMSPDGSRPFDNSLFIMTRVVSAHHRGWVITDAGSKSFSTDGPMPVIAAGAPEGSTYRFFGDEFGRIDLPDGASSPPIGRLIKLIVPHCDPTINLYDEYTVVEDGHVVGSWPIEARGKSR